MARNTTLMRWTRASALSAALAVLSLLALLGASLPTHAVNAQDDVETAATPQSEPSPLGEPTTLGGVRPGPLGIAPDPLRVRGAQPVAIQIEKAQVDAQVEQQEIIDGVMQNPSGPFVVSWYRGTGKLGELDNIVMAGHLDYWDVGEAVFFHIGDLTQGDEIKITGEDNEVYTYRVDWVRNFTVDELTGDAVRDIVGSTPTEELTLITCGGPFDSERGEYLERMVVRATRVP